MIFSPLDKKLSNDQNREKRAPEPSDRSAEIVDLEEEKRSASGQKQVSLAKGLEPYGPAIISLC